MGVLKSLAPMLPTLHPYTTKAISTWLNVKALGSLRIGTCSLELSVKDYTLFARPEGVGLGAMMKIIVGIALLVMISFVVIVARGAYGEDEGPTPSSPGLAPCDYEDKGFCVSWTGDVYYDPSIEHVAYFFEFCRVNEEQGNEPLICQKAENLERIGKMQF